VYLLMTDETNVRPNENARFFCYGGLIVPFEHVARLSARIEAIRVDCGYRRRDSLKFDTNARPRHVELEQARNAKRRVIRACIANECRFIAYVVLHAIARNTAQRTLVEWGADHVIGKFNYFLTTEDSHGLVQVDRLPNQNEYNFLSSKFVNGLTFGEDEHIPLDRILLLGATCINASHVASAMDIVLGSFRYCINTRRDNEAARAMMLQLSRLIWAEREGEDLHAFEKGLVFRPKNVQHELYREEYDNLLNHINGLLAEREE
jgi:hypothetical protein